MNYFYSYALMKKVFKQFIWKVGAISYKYNPMSHDTLEQRKQRRELREREIGPRIETNRKNRPTRIRKLGSSGFRAQYGKRFLFSSLIELEDVKRILGFLFLFYFYLF